MPAEGAMSTTAEAPVQEPRSVSGPIGVRVESVRRAYRTRRGTVPALDGMTLRTAPGEVVTVVGTSGCGKSTLLELVCGLQQPDAGTVAADPAVLMPQRDVLLPWLSALDNAALARRVRGVGRAAARDAARPLFDRFGL